MGQFSHPNLIKLLGVVLHDSVSYCYKNYILCTLLVLIQFVFLQFKILIEIMQIGDLRNHLLSLTERFVKNQVG